MDQDLVLRRRLVSRAKLRTGLVLAAAAVLLLGAACRPNHPPAPPEVTGRPAVRPGDTIVLSAVSTDQDNNLISYLFSWGDDGGGVWSADYPSGVAVSAGHAYAESGAYAVSARARDNKGAESDWSPAETLRVGVFLPGIPARPKGPTQCEHGGTYAWTSSAASPYGESLFIQFDWGDTLGSWDGPVKSESVRIELHSYDTAGSYSVRARSRDKLGLLSDWSDTLKVAVSDSANRAPDITQGPDGPVSIYIDGSYTYAVTVTDANGDSVSARFDWGDSATSDWTGWFASGEEITSSHAWDDTGAFEVKAQARDRKLALSDWSAPLSVQVLPRPDLPSVPSGPTLCLKDSAYAYKSAATDRFGDSVSLRFDWGDGDTSDWSPFAASGESAAMSHAWSQAGQYEVRAQARDPELRLTDWSGSLAVEVILHRGPNTPAAPDGPVNGEKDSVYEFTAYGTHPDNLPVAIRFDWGDGDTSSWSQFVASGESVTMSHAWSEVRTYSVRAQAKDTGNLMSGWSAAHNIVIGPIDTLRIWRFMINSVTGQSNYSSPAIAPDGTIYVGSQDDYVYALNPDGTLKWRYLTGDVVRSSPAIAADGTIYVGSYDNRLYALNPDGTLKWSYLTGGNVSSSPAIAADGTIIFGSSDNRIYALNPDSTLRWSYVTAGAVYSSPSIAPDSTIYCGSDDNYLYALTAEGTLKWRYAAAGNIETSPAIAADGTAYFGSFDDALYALNPDSTLKWTFHTSGQVRSSPAIAPDGTICFGSTDNYFYALNPDGTLRWWYMTGDNVNSSPAISSNGTIYFGSDDNYLYALGADSVLTWSYPTAFNIESSPTIGPDGTVYFVGYDGYLYALRGTSPLAGSAWPKFRHDIKNTGRSGGGR
jgi:outer membrane protein assembly factor BamB